MQICFSAHKILFHAARLGTIGIHAQTLKARKQTQLRPWQQHTPLYSSPLRGSTTPVMGIHTTVDACHWGQAYTVEQAQCLGTHTHTHSCPHFTYTLVCDSRTQRQEAPNEISNDFLLE